MKTNEVLEDIKARRSVHAYTTRQVAEEDWERRVTILKYVNILPRWVGNNK